MYSSSALFWVIWNGDRNRTTTRGFGREAMWRQREVSPELPSDLPGETKKKGKREKHVLSEIWIWISECLVCYTVLWQQPLFFQVMSWSWESL